MLPESSLLIIQCKKVVPLREKEANGEGKKYLVWFGEEYQSSEKLPMEASCVTCLEKFPVKKLVVAVTSVEM